MYKRQNYECYKGLYSSFNTMNLFEIGYSLNRQFGPEPWALYRGRPLLNFLDNHDVERIASILADKAHLRPAWGLLFGMPGVPAVYYGSEWGAQAVSYTHLIPATARRARGAAARTPGGAPRARHGATTVSYTHLSMLNTHTTQKPACPKRCITPPITPPTATAVSAISGRIQM